MISLQNNNNKSLLTLDIALFACVVILIGIGIGFLYSANRLFGVRQIIFLSVGFIFFVIASFVNCDIYKRMIKPIVICTIIMLILTLIPHVGVSIKGASRWLGYGSFRFQPSELAKMVIVFYLAAVLSDKENEITDFMHGILPPLIMTGFISILVFLEPDFSTTFLMLFTALVLFYLAGMKISSLIILILSGTTAGVAMLFAAPYRARRLFAFLNPWEEPLGSGWHYIQSMKCFALGKLFGVGIGESTQKIYALPEAHNDYIFAIIAEEGGIIFAILIVLLFAAFTIIGLLIARRSKDRYTYLLASGITMIIFFQAMTNVAVVVGMLPSTGITLPFISSGGTSLIIFMTAIGILLNISRRQKKL